MGKHCFAHTGDFNCEFSKSFISKKNHPECIDEEIDEMLVFYKNLKKDQELKKILKYVLITGKIDDKEFYLSFDMLPSWFKSLQYCYLQ